MIKTAIVLLLLFGLAACGPRPMQEAPLVGMAPIAESLTHHLLANPEVSRQQTLNRVFDRARFNFSQQLGRLEIDSTEGFSLCTAVIVSRNILLSSAHCFVGNSVGDTVTRVSFIPGQLSNQDDNSLRYFAKRVVLPKSHLQNPVPGNDLAVIELFENEMAYSLEEHFSPIAISTSHIVGGELLVAGYPKSEPDATLAYSICKNEKYNYTDNLRFHRCTTKKGMSGAPVLAWNNSLSRFELVGIHSGFSDSKNMRTFRNLNLAAMDLISDAVSSEDRSGFLDIELRPNFFFGVHLQNECGQDVHAEISQRRYGTKSQKRSVKLANARRSIAFEAIAGEIYFKFYDSRGSQIMAALGDNPELSWTSQISIAPGQAPQDITLGLRCSD